MTREDGLDRTRPSLGSAAVGLGEEWASPSRWWPGGKVPGESRADTAAGAAMGRDLSQISHGLTGRHWTMASMPDTEQDADVQIRIPAH